MAKEILPEARWALALGKLRKKLLPVLPPHPTSHYILVPYLADFFLANLMLFLAAVFHNKFQVRKEKKKTQRGNLLLPTARERFSGVKTSTRVFACSSSIWLCRDDLFTRQGHLTQVLTA